MHILVTGGLGFIGSHTVIKLIESNHSVTIIDNLSNSHLGVLNSLHTITNVKIPFYEADVKNLVELEQIFKENDFDGVIHFAGYKAVGESVLNPLKYYENNILSTINLLKLCELYNVYHFVFSSSATVYGDNTSPMVEDMTLLSTSNPYGETKAMCERILKDVANSNSQFKISLLRYFNPIGAHESGLIGESPNGIPNNLMPYITQVAAGKRDQLSVFGNDYPTVDGTGVRDYIHVDDLASGHVAALEKSEPGVEAYNLGTGRGTSVLELIHTFEKVNDIKIPYQIVERRPGDNAVSFANPSKANRELDWACKKTVADMCRDAWNFEKSNTAMIVK